MLSGINMEKNTESMGNLGYAWENPQVVIRDKRGKTQKAWEILDTHG
jgi:hypothetical protein